MRKYHTDRVAYQQQKFISLSSGDQENPDQGAGRFGIGESLLPGS